MIYSHSALSLHQWEDMEAERIQSYFEIKLEKKKQCLCLDALYCSGFTTFIRWFTLVCLPQLQFHCYDNKAGPLTSNPVQVT